MRRITFVIMSTLAAVIMLFSYRTSTQGSRAVPAAGGANAPGVVSGNPGPSPTPGSTVTAPGSPVVANGTTAQTRWGPVQVQVTISAGTITDVTPLQQPSGNQRDEQINSYALPQLHDQVIQAQSADIDGISGATVTSEGYISSLQSALDAAHFG
jgi:uncharacterized protein with FMN-binding domain